MIRADGFDHRDGVLHFLMPPHLREITARLYLRGPLLNGTEGRPSEIQKRLLSELGSQGLVAPMQVHGTAVVPALPLWALPQKPRADAVFVGTDHPIWGSLRFADCTPVLVAGEEKSPWVLGIHSGFQGTVRGIVPKVLSQLRELYRGPVVDEHTHAWIGPAIGRCCYGRKKEDPSTVKGLSVFPDDCREEREHEVFFDLHRMIAHQLKCAGVSDENIHLFPHCTSCNPELYYSWRKGDAADRMFLLFGKSPFLKEQWG